MHNWSTFKTISTSAGIWALLGKTGGTLKMCLFFPALTPQTSWEEEEERGRVALKLSPSCFMIPLPLFVHSLPFLWFCKWGVWDAASSVKPLCWHQRKKKGGGQKREKTKRQSGLKEQPGFGRGSRSYGKSAGSALQQSGGRMEEEGWIGVLAMSPLWCAFVLSAIRLLSSTPPYAHKHTLTEIWLT